MESLELTGHAGRRIEVQREERGGAHRIVILPGYVYAPWMALYQLMSELAARRHADLLVGAFGYDRAEGFLEMPEEAHWAMVGDDAEALLRLTSLERGGRISIVGKSLGTRQCAALLERGLVPDDVPVVWLTPTLRSARLRAASHAGRSLWIAGDADAHFDRGAWDEVTARPRTESLLVEGAGHGMERDDPYLTLDAWRATLSALDRFLFAVETPAASRSRS